MIVVGGGYVLLLGWTVLRFAVNVAMLPVVWLCDEYPFLGLLTILALITAWWFTFFGHLM